MLCVRNYYPPQLLTLEWLELRQKGNSFRVPPATIHSTPNRPVVSIVWLRLTILNIIQTYIHSKLSLICSHVIKNEGKKSYETNECMKRGDYRLRWGRQWDVRVALGMNCVVTSCLGESLLSIENSPDFWLITYSQVKAIGWGNVGDAAEMITLKIHPPQNDIQSIPLPPPQKAF